MEEVEAKVKVKSLIRMNSNRNSLTYLRLTMCSRRELALERRLFRR